MKSGIYLLEFSDGSFYIGKSTDIDKRWNQHRKNMSDGKHTKKVQEAFNRCGAPTFRVVMWCHADHIDIMETYYINEAWGSPKLLNTTKPPKFSQKELNILEQTLDSEIWSISTFEHLLSISNTQEELRKLKGTVSKSKSVSKLKSLEYEVEDLRARYKALHDASWWDRLFNWPPK